MSTDRELLELAAKAVGIRIEKSPFNGGGHGNDGFDIMGSVVLDWHNGTTWNPLTDDGDALRLLGAMPSLWSLSLKFGAPTVEMNVWWGAGGEKTNKIAREFAGDGADVAAAIRRAIVRAAAEIGRAAP